MNQKSVRSKLRGNIEALHVLAQGASSRFEFIFACVEAKQTTGLNHNQRDMRLVDTINKILQSYKGAELYREIKLRTALFEGKELIMLREEKVYSRVTGVWNLSADQGSLGNFILTSVRVIWVAETNPMFNVSLPWVQVEQIKMKDSKFGRALVLISSPSSVKYTLGFRIDPEDRCRQVGKEMAQLLKAHQAQPELGVFEQPNKPVSMPLAFDEDVVIEQGTQGDSARVYQLDGDRKRAEPVYDEELGLLVERMAENVSMEKLFCV